MKDLPKRRALAQTFLTSVAIQVLTVVSGVIVARVLQPEGRGVFAAIQLWPGVFAAISWLGVNYSLAMRAARQPDDITRLARTANALSLLSSVLFVAGGWVLLPYLLPAGQPELVTLSRWFLVIIPVNTATAYLQALDQGAGRLKSFNTTRHFISVFYLAIVVALWAANLREPVWFMAGLLAANIATLLLRLHLTGWSCLQLDFDFSRIAALVRAGRGYLATSVFFIAKENVERLVLLFLLGSQQLGLYVVAATASGLHTTLTKSVNVLVLPRSGALAESDGARDSARIFRVMAIVSAGLSLAMLIVLPVLIPLVFGRSFQGAVAPALILTLAQYSSGQGAIIDESLRAQGRPWVPLMASLISVAVFFALALPAADRLGIAGVALASLPAQAAYCIVLAAYLKRRFRIQLLPKGEDFKFLRTNFLTILARVNQRNAPAVDTQP